MSLHNENQKTSSTENQNITAAENHGGVDEAVGLKIREIRNLHGLTLKQLAEISDLNINTLSLLENGKTSPTIFTLQRLATAMGVSLKDLFEPVESVNSIVFTKYNSRPQTVSEKAVINNLGKGLTSSTLEPFVLTMEKFATSGGRNLLHSGFEFVYCLSGKILYCVQEQEFILMPGDSILFSAQHGHRWENINDGKSQLLLVFTPACGYIEQGKKHFNPFEGS